MSPGKGLLIYSPFLVWLFVTNPVRRHPQARLAMCLVLAPVALNGNRVAPGVMIAVTPCPR